jgi:hypothetical protein
MTKPQAPPHTDEELRPLEDFLAEVIDACPYGDSPQTRQQVWRLAHFWRLLDYYGRILESDPASAFAADLFQKLNDKASRLEDSLGIKGFAPKSPAAATLPSPRRED